MAKDTQTSRLFSFLYRHGIPRRYLKESKKSDYSVSFDGAYSLLEKKGLFIYGGVGTGKTQMVVDLMSKLTENKQTETVIGTDMEVKNGNPVFTENKIKVYDNKLFKFYSAPKLLAHIRGMFNTNKSIEDFLESLNEYEYLIIDDLGTEKTSEWVLEMFYVIINDRYDQMNKIIITSNKNLSEISDSLGDRISSRIREMCSIIELKGNDKRLT